MITNINEFKLILENISNIKVTDKDWERMLKLYLVANDDNINKVVNSIKDKNKAITRFVAGQKMLKNGELKFDGERYKNYFRLFGNKALELGATVEEIQTVFDNTIIPEKYLDKLKVGSTKKYDDRFVGTIKFLNRETLTKESVRYETKFVWWVNKDFTTDYKKTENDISEDACCGWLEDDDNVLVYGSEGVERNAVFMANRAIEELKTGALKITLDSKEYYYNLEEM